MGDLWNREPGVIYGADFTNHSLTRTYHGPFNHRMIVEVVRVYHRDLFPDHIRTENIFQCGMHLKLGGFLRFSPPFASLGEAKDWAMMSGEPDPQKIIEKFREIKAAWPKRKRAARKDSSSSPPNREARRDEQ